MDFRFRAIDNKPPPTAAASTSVRSSDLPLQDDALNEELMKQRIKEEILIREIASRRMLEAEIRRELLLEQEIAMRKAAGKIMEADLSFDEKFAVRLLDRKIRMNQIVDPTAVPPGSSSNSLNSLPPVHPFPALQKEELKPVDDEKNKLIILPRPDRGKFKGKRKAEGEPAATATTTTTTTVTATAVAAEGYSDQRIPKKIGKEEFVCRMCNVKATSEVSLNLHLKGKKHMAKLERNEKAKVEQPDETKPGLENEKKVLKFWCKICQIGTPCMAAMVSHNNGRKHKARLFNLSQQQSKLDHQKDQP